MNKKELIRYIAHTANLNKQQAQGALAAFWQAISETLQNGKIVKLVGKGKFGVKSISGRTITHLHTRQTVIIPARTRIYFKASKKFKVMITKQLSENKNV
jgi:nucleoid DNA-binding protein